MYTEYYLYCHWCIYIIYCRKWSNLKHTGSCGAVGGKMKLPQAKKNKAGGSRVRPLHKHPLLRKRWCCLVTIPHKTAWAHFKHVQVKTIVSKVTALIGTLLGCLQHTNPGQASIWGVYQAVCRWSVSPHGRLQHFYFCKDKETSHTRWQYSIIFCHLLPGQNCAGILRH